MLVHGNLISRVLLHPVIKINNIVILIIISMLWYHMLYILLHKYMFIVILNITIYL